MLRRSINLLSKVPALGLACCGCLSLQRRLTAVVGRRQPLAVFRLPACGQDVVALTIDDGPSMRTAEMLDLLAAHRATATFFVHTDHIDHVPNGETLIARMLSEGHEIGHHMPADTPSIAMTADQFAAEFARSNERLRGLDARPEWFRPAGAAFDDQRMGPTLARHGFARRYVLGSYLPWDVSLGWPERYAAQLAKGAFSGAILVLHDGDHQPSRAERTLTTLGRLLPLLAERGFAACSLSGCAKSR